MNRLGCAFLVSLLSIDSAIAQYYVMAYYPHEEISQGQVDVVSLTLTAPAGVIYAQTTMHAGEMPTLEYQVRNQCVVARPIVCQPATEPSEVRKPPAPKPNPTPVPDPAPLLKTTPPSPLAEDKPPAPKPDPVPDPPAEGLEPKLIDPDADSRPPSDAAVEGDQSIAAPLVPVPRREHMRQVTSSPLVPVIRPRRGVEFGGWRPVR